MSGFVITLFLFASRGDRTSHGCPVQTTYPHWRCPQCRRRWHLPLPPRFLAWSFRVPSSAFTSFSPHRESGTLPHLVRGISVRPVGLLHDSVRLDLLPSLHSPPPLERLLEKELRAKSQPVAPPTCYSSEPAHEDDGSEEGKVAASSASIWSSFELSEKRSAGRPFLPVLILLEVTLSPT